MNRKLYRWMKRLKNYKERLMKLQKRRKILLKKKIILIKYYFFYNNIDKENIKIMIKIKKNKKKRKELITKKALENYQ